MASSPQQKTDSASGMLITMSLRMLPIATPIAAPSLGPGGVLSEPCTPVVMRSSSSQDLLCLSAEEKESMNANRLWNFSEAPMSRGPQAMGGVTSFDDSLLNEQASNRSVHQCFPVHKVLREAQFFCI